MRMMDFRLFFLKSVKFWNSERILGISGYQKQPLKPVFEPPTLVGDIRKNIVPVGNADSNDNIFFFIFLLFASASL